MNKFDLKDGMMVEVRKGAKYLALGNKLIGINDYFPLTYYNEDLTHMNGLKEWDIIKISEVVSGDTFSEIFIKTQIELWVREEIREYRLGLEDGFDTIRDAISDGYNAITYTSTRLVPYIKTETGKMYIEKGDYIHIKGKNKNLYRKVI